MFFAFGYAEIIAECRTQPGNEIIRNYGLLAIAFWGAVLAVWRSQIANKQADAANAQAETANRQAETAERGHMNDRYQKAADMIGSKSLSVRLGGIYALDRLALDHPEDYLDPVIKLVCAFARHPTEDETNNNVCKEQHTPRQDVVEALWIICGLNEKDEDHNKPNLEGMDLSGAIMSAEDIGTVNLGKMRLSGAKMLNADLVAVSFAQTELINTNLAGARLIGADFTGANLFRADLSGADLSGANLSGARGLTQEQLDQAGQSLGGSAPNLPRGYTWDEKAARERWRILHDEQE